MTNQPTTADGSKAFGIRTMILLVLIAAVDLSVYFAVDFVRRAGPTHWPPEYRYMSRIPFARKSFGRWP